MKTQKKAPIADMFRRYWMLPYHAAANSSSPPLPEGGGKTDSTMKGLKLKNRFRVFGVLGVGAVRGKDFVS